MTAMNRIRAAWHALFVRKPSITVEVVGDTWNAKWRHMSADDASMLLHCVNQAMRETSFARMPCGETIH